MADDYTPTENEVARRYTGGPNQAPGYRGRLHEFDRWLAAHAAEKDAVIAAQAAVIEAARAKAHEVQVSKWDTFGEHVAAEFLVILDGAPSVSLDAVKAEAWDEGYRRRAGDAQGCVVNNGRSANPYRSGVRS